MSGSASSAEASLTAPPRPASSQLILRALHAHPGARWLMLCGAIPEWAAEHRGKLTLITRELPDRPLASPDLALRQVKTVEELVAALEDLKPRPGERAYDVVFVDFYHELQSIIRQLEALRPFYDARTLFLFDDAVPPSIEMTGPLPQAGKWWVGEVWMLKHLLRPEGPGGFVQTIATAPTGLMAARSFAAPDPVGWAMQREELAEVDSDAALAAQFNHSSPDAFAAQMLGAIQKSDARDSFAVVPGAPIEFARSVEQLDIERSWIKPEPLFAIDLPARGTDFSHISRSPRPTHGTYLCDFDDVELLGFGMLRKGTSAFIRYEQGMTGYLERLAAHPEDYSNENTGVRLSENGYRIERDLSQPVLVEQPLLFATPDEPDNWGMWLFQGVRSAIEFQREPDRYEKFLCAVRAPWQRALLAAAGLDLGRLMEQDVTCHYRLRRAGLLTQTRRDLILTENDCAAFDELVERMLPQASVTAHPRIFVSRLSRTQHGAYRGLAEEEALIDALAELGFVAVEPEMYALADQIKLFRSAEVVVGLGGAAMFNTAFCRAPTRVITIESTRVYLDAHTNIFASRGLDYGVIMGEEDLSDPRTEHRRWRLDVPSAVAAVRSIL